ncbi:MAG: family 43 glycosylhydrolase [Clostridia bacterium]|nr:family 43 glycosylhydrolase [Clostridia bacterium]
MAQIYNPYLPLNEYIPDGEPHVFGDRVYIFGSHDREGGDTFCELDYVSYSADIHDLTQWRFEGTIYSSSKDPHSREKAKGGGQRKYLYAPDVVRGNDGRYYLYYCLSGRAGKGGFDGPISAAVCDTPAGEYEYIGDVKYADGSAVYRYIPFDPAAINDDGRIYLYYGWSLPIWPTNNPIKKNAYYKVMQNVFHKDMQEIKTEPLGIMGANVLELEDDMLTVKGEIKRIIPCEMDAKGTDFEGHAFFEASSIRKVNGLFYFIYSSTHMHELCYAVSKYPDKGFKYGGTIVSNGDIGIGGRKEKDRLCFTGNNHGSIELINGSWYIFYHRHTHMSSYSRQGCAEKIEIAEDGSIKQVEMTSCGLNGGPLEAKGEYPAVIACNLTDGKMPHAENGITKKKKPHITHEHNDRFISGICNNTFIGYKYFDFEGATLLSVTTRGKAKGKITVTDEAGNTYGEIEMMPSNSWIESKIEINISGIHALNFTFKGKGRGDMLKFAFSRK